MTKTTAFEVAKDLMTKAASKGFEWSDAKDALGKIDEELKELGDATQHEHRVEELGDLLQAITNYARMMGINPEEALISANQKFDKRFKDMEDDAAAQGQVFESLTLKEQIKLWIAQKPKL